MNFEASDKSIALEQNLDKIGQRKNYVDYIANRPRVENMGRIFENNVPPPAKTAIGLKVDSKLMRKMRKKVGQGHKQDESEQSKYIYL